MARGEPLIRQWNLLRVLQAHRFGVGVDELTQRMECSKRQVQRDLQVLQTVGFPISFEERDFDKRYWKLAPHFLESGQLSLSVTEMLSLFLSQQLLVPLAGTQMGSGLATALEKIKAMLPRKALGYFQGLDGTLLVKSVGKVDYSGHDKQIAILNQGIQQCRVLQVQYHSASQNRTLVTAFHPYGLVFLGSNLYSIGHLEEYDEVRTLKISRFKGVKMTARTFQRPKTFSLAAYTQGAFGIFGPGKPQTIKARFSGWAATSLREHQWHLSQKIIKDVGEHVVACFELSDSTEFKRWLLGFGRHALVLAPKALVAEVAEELMTAGAAYGRAVGGAD